MPRRMFKPPLALEAREAVRRSRAAAPAAEQALLDGSQETASRGLRPLGAPAPDCRQSADVRPSVSCEHEVNGELVHERPHVPGSFHGCLLTCLLEIVEVLAGLPDVNHSPVWPNRPRRMKEIPVRRQRALFLQLLNQLVKALAAHVRERLQYHDGHAVSFARVASVRTGFQSSRGWPLWLTLPTREP